MERADLLEANGGIFKPQGEAIAAGAADDIKVLVVGNPANTNALIAMSNADGVPNERFTAMTRLDHNRAIAQLAQKTGAAVSEITNMAIWGNHSPSMYPDLFNAKVQAASARGTSSATRRGSRTSTSRASASAARRSSRRAARRRPPAPPPPRSTTCYDWVNGTADGDWVSMAVPSDGSYGVPEGIITSFPVTTAGGECEDRPGPRRARVLPRAHHQDRRRAAQEEREAVAKLGLV